jgi:hypothetical protein
VAVPDDQKVNAQKVLIFREGGMPDPSAEPPRIECRTEEDRAEFDAFGAELLPHYRITAPFDAPAGAPCSLTVVEFGPGYLLPLHSHGVDCLYYVERGSLRMGNETLGPGDGFFVPKDQPYAYRAGPEGVKVLEFRVGGRFDDFRLLETNVQGWKNRFRKSVAEAAGG